MRRRRHRQRRREEEPAEGKAGVVCPLSVGTAFNAKLLDTLDARRNKAGDKFTAETTESVRYGRSVILPRGTIIEGHVVRRSISTHGPDRAALFLQFDKAILKNGQETVMNAGIQALAVGPNASAAVETASGTQLIRMPRRRCGTIPGWFEGRCRWIRI